jgi:hypothetical protein
MSIWNLFSSEPNRDLENELEEMKAGKIQSAEDYNIEASLIGKFFDHCAFVDKLSPEKQFMYNMLVTTRMEVPWLLLSAEKQQESLEWRHEMAVQLALEL